MSKKNMRNLLKTGFEKNANIINLDKQQLEKVKQILMEMLEDFLKVADKYSIKYTLSGGSVLGAVRHEGFIPWDDDIDLNMTRKEYLRFVEVFEKELSDKYVLCTPEKTHDHGMLCAQIKKKDTIFRSINELTKDEDVCGIPMDIFVIENTYNNRCLRMLQGMISLVFGYISTCRKTEQDYVYMSKYLEGNEELKKGILKKVKFGRLFKWLSLDKVTRLASSCYAMCKDDNSKYVTIPSGRGHFFKELHLRSELCEAVDAKFEHLVVKIPKGYDTYLRSLYGNNYMKLPPKEQQETHPVMELKL